MRNLVHKTLLDGITGTDNGTWIDVDALKEKTVHVTGITTATIKVMGANTPTVPTAATHHIQIGDDITANAILDIPAHVKWIKAYCSAWTAGTIYAYLNAIEER